MMKEFQEQFGKSEQLVEGKGGIEYLRNAIDLARSISDDGQRQVAANAVQAYSRKFAECMERKLKEGLAQDDGWCRYFGEVAAQFQRSGFPLDERLGEVRMKVFKELWRELSPGQQQQLKEEFLKT
ncbi:MAG: hypothetical protein HYZ88_00970 [Candidatus Omnitrophica bacterium]|nr:hypothetical protein [Candidatus Omnitrophota bacterium]